MWSFEFSWNHDNNWLYNSSLFGLNAVSRWTSRCHSISCSSCAFDIICATDPDTWYLIPPDTSGVLTHPLYVILQINHWIMNAFSNFQQKQNKAPGCDVELICCWPEYDNKLIWRHPGNDVNFAAICTSIVVIFSLVISSLLAGPLGSFFIL